METRTKRYSVLRKKLKITSKEELTEEIAKRVKEIRDLYYKVYPEGDYMTMCIFRDYMRFNNSPDEDKDFYIDYCEREDNECSL